MTFNKILSWAPNLLMAAALAFVCAMCAWMLGWGDLYQGVDGPNAGRFYGCIMMMLGVLIIHVLMTWAWRRIESGRTEVGNPIFFVIPLLVGGAVLILGAALLTFCVPGEYWWRMGLGSCAVGIMIMAGCAFWRIHMFFWRPTPPAAPTTRCGCCA